MHEDFTRCQRPCGKPPKPKDPCGRQCEWEPTTVENPAVLILGCKLTTWPKSKKSFEPKFKFAGATYRLMGVIYGDGVHFTACFRRVGIWHFYDDMRNRGRVEKVEKNLPAVQNASYLFYLRKCPEDTRSLSVPTVGPQFLRSKNQQAVEVGMNRVTLLLVELKSRFPIVSRSDFGVKQNERKKERNKGYLYSLNSTLTYREGRRSSKETKIVWTVSVINVRKDCH